MSVSQRLRGLVRDPSRHAARLGLAAMLVATACANPPWATTTTQHPHAGPLPPGDDPNAPPPAPFADAEKDRIRQVQPYVERASSSYELDPNLIHAVIWVESRHQPRAKSSAGARGLMQLMPATANAMARQLGRPMARVYDPEFNVQAGSLYLSRLLEKYEGDETLALAAYNAGPGNVDKWLKGDGLPPVSLEYVGLVMEAKRRFVALGGEWSLPLEDEGATRLATAAKPAPRPEPHVPDPPPAAEDEREPAPVTNPLAPSPDVYKPTPPLEPPLRDTPYPPLEDDTRSRTRASTRAAQPQRQPRAEPSARPEPRPSPVRGAVRADDDELPPPPRGLPSVLD